jgi:hypothetical protein
MLHPLDRLVIPLLPPARHKGMARQTACGGKETNTGSIGADKILDLVMQQTGIADKGMSCS